MAVHSTVEVFNTMWAYGHDDHDPSESLRTVFGVYDGLHEILLVEEDVDMSSFTVWQHLLRCVPLTMNYGRDSGYAQLAYCLTVYDPNSLRINHGRELGYLHNSDCITEGHPLLLGLAPNGNLKSSPLLPQIELPPSHFSMAIHSAPHATSEVMSTFGKTIPGQGFLVEDADATATRTVEYLGKKYTMKNRRGTLVIVQKGLIHATGRFFRQVNAIGASSTGANIGLDTSREGPDDLVPARAVNLALQGKFGVKPGLWIMSLILSGSIKVAKVPSYLAEVPLNDDGMDVTAYLGSNILGSLQLLRNPNGDVFIDYGSTYKALKLTRSRYKYPGVLDTVVCQDENELTDSELVLLESGMKLSS
jgi:hypothetical protein